MVQLEHDEELGPMHGTYGTLEAGLEVQRTIKRGLLKKVGIIDGLWKGEMKCIGWKAKRCGFGFLKKCWEELHYLRSNEILIEVEHVKAHRTEKERQRMSLVEKFITEGNEKADELAKQGAMVDEGFMAQARASKIQQEREEVYTASQYAASFPLLGGGVERL